MLEFVQGLELGLVSVIRWLEMDFVQYSEAAEAAECRYLVH